MTFDPDNLTTHPEWLSDEALKVLAKGYLLPGETARDMWKRCAGTAGKILERPDIGTDILEMFWLGFFGGANCYQPQQMTKNIKQNWRNS